MREVEYMNDIRSIREETGLSRKAFSDKYQIPLRTMEEWEAGRRKPPEYVSRMLKYYVSIKQWNEQRDEKINIVEDATGHKIVIVNDIRFKGKRNIDWKEVKEYLKEYVGTNYSIQESSEQVYIGNKFPEEFTESESRKALKGANAKAKANSATIIPGLIQIATNPIYEENRKEKHEKDAKYGWYKYEVRFALPVYEDEVLVKYNIYRAKMLINHAENDKKYLYDLISIKKETSKPQQEVW